MLPPKITLNKTEVPEWLGVTTEQFDAWVSQGRIRAIEGELYLVEDLTNMIKTLWYETYPKEEVDLYQNPKDMASVRRGLKEVAEGKIKELNLDELGKNSSTEQLCQVGESLKELYRELTELKNSEDEEDRELAKLVEPVATGIESFLATVAQAAIAAPEEKKYCVLRLGVFTNPTETAFHTCVWEDGLDEKEEMKRIVEQFLPEGYILENLKLVTKENGPTVERSIYNQRKLVAKYITLAEHTEYCVCEKCKGQAERSCK